MSMCNLFCNGRMCIQHVGDLILSSIGRLSLSRESVNCEFCRHIRDATQRMHTYTCTYLNSSLTCGKKRANWMFTRLELSRRLDLITFHLPMNHKLDRVIDSALERNWEKKWAAPLEYLVHVERVREEITRQLSAAPWLAQIRYTTLHLTSTHRYT